MAGLLLSGCVSSPRIKDLAKVGPDKAIVVAKFRVIYNDKDITKGCNVIFNNKQQFILDETGSVYAALPPGRNSIRNVIHKSGFMQHHFAIDDLTCDLVGGGVINYLGDITFNWHGMGSGSGFLLAAISPVISSVATGGGANVLVETNTAAAQGHFQEQFPGDHKFVPALLVVKPRQ